MARRRKYNKRGDTWFKNIDWGLRPETVREVGALVLGVLGIILILSIFSSAGNVGLYFARMLDKFFGYVGYFILFVFVILSALLLFPKRFAVKAITYVGIIMSIIFIPALVNPWGGIIGSGVRLFIENLIGSVASFILVFGLSIISILVAFNTSISEIKENFGSNDDEKTDVKIHGANEPQTRVSVFTTVKDKMGLNRSNNAPNMVQKEQKAVLSMQEDSNWQNPSIDLLELSTSKATSGNIAKNVETIQKTLGDFNIDVSMGDVNVGPTVTQYTLKPKEGIKLNQITARSNDLALSLAAHPIRIEAPIPGKAAVGVEIPNKIPAIVTLREIIDSKEFETKKSNLTLALGRDVAGIPVIADLKKMPHLLIAGATGSGKSICLNSVIVSLLYQNSPSSMRMILVDPKRVEFTRFNDIPHLLCPVITEVDKTVNALKWAVAEMDRRFKLFSSNGRRDIESYNADPTDGMLPYIVIVIDELADLMAQSGREVEAVIVRLAQMARAVGIHLIVATQRPSVDVITGLIKANIISRIAFAVASQIDSRTILDMSGAEKLLGNGDMLHVSADMGKPKRVQGTYISEKEVQDVTDFLKKQTAPQYDESIINFASHRGNAGGGGGSDMEDDMFEEAKEVVIQAGKASASLLQRRLRVGYARAARLLDILESEGTIGPADGAKPRDVMVSPSELAFERQYKETTHQSAPPTNNNQFGMMNRTNNNQQSQSQNEPPEELTEVDLR
jgi:S-DNA-T family DNA segregation ATPase FtsK/SpoIIIE